MDREVLAAAVAPGFLNSGIEGSGGRGTGRETTGAVIASLDTVLGWAWRSQAGRDLNGLEASRLIEC